jgi:glucose-6-phosphate 1-dehydrogenase
MSSQLAFSRDEGISIAFGAKRPGTQMRTVTVQANFSYQASFGSKGPVAYETLLLDSMRGDATLFTRRDEVPKCHTVNNAESPV